MVGAGDVFLNLVEFVGVRYVNRVLLSIQSVQLQCIVNLREVHRSSNCSTSAEELNIQRVVRYTKNHTLQVIRSVNRVLGVGYFTEGTGPASNSLDTHRRYTVHQFLSYVAVQVIQQLLLIIKHIRNRDYIVSWLKACIYGGSKDQHLKRTSRQLFDTSCSISTIQRSVTGDGEF